MNRENPQTRAPQGKKKKQVKAKTRKRKQQFKSKQLSAGAVTRAMRKLSIPLEEQDRMVRTVGSVPDTLIQRYVATLINPAEYKSAIPDSYLRPTYTVTSRQVLDIPINVSASLADAGRFSMCIQPHMGGLATPSSYKVGYVTSFGSWDQQDFGNAITYTQSVGGYDPRLDRNYLTLTLPPLGNYVLNASLSVTPFQFQAASTSPYEPGSNSCFQYNTPGVRMQNNTAGNLGCRWKLPVGQYLFQWFGITANTFSSGPTINVVVGTATDLQKDTVRSFRSVDLTTSIYSSLLNVRAPLTVELVTPLTAVGSTYTVAQVSITPTFYEASSQVGTAPFAVNANSYPTGMNGIVQQYRTVGMSALISYVGTILNAGGTVAAAYVNGSLVKEAFYTNAPVATYGALQNWENLANLPGAQASPITDGKYLWWAPEADEEIEFRDPDFPNSTGGQNASSLIISGQYNPGVLASDQTMMVMKVEINTVYEILSASQLFTPVSTRGTQNILDQANLALADQPHVMKNGEHVSWIKDFLGGVKQGLSYWEKPAQFAWNNRDKILPVLGGIGAML